MSSVVIEFLGTGDAFGTGGRFHSCLLVKSDEAPLLIDCGASAVTALQQRRIDPRDIGFILLSHLHGDHFGGLPFLLLDAAYNRPRHEPLVIAGPSGTEARLRDTLDLLFPGAGTILREVAVRIVEWQARRPIELGTVKVTPFAARHSQKMPCFALRLRIGDRVIAYSGDTEWTDDLIDASRDADLFVCECVGYDRPVPSHLSLTTLAAHADRLSAKRIVLTHLGPQMVARPAGADWECARDGLTITL